MIVFKVLQLDNASLLGYAKAQVQRLVSGGLSTFARTWMVNGTEIRVRCVEARDGAVSHIARVWISGESVAINRLAFNFNGTDAFNFRVQAAPTTDTVPWYQVITPVEFASLGHSCTFRVEQGSAGQGFGAVRSPVRYINALRRCVVARNRAARYWLYIIGDAMSVQYKGVTIGLQPEELFVSEATSDGDFQLLLGHWELERLGDGTFKPATPNAPRWEKFIGVTVAAKDLVRVVKGPLVDFDNPPRLANGSIDPTYAGPRLYGELRTTTLPSVVVATGEEYKREESGKFPSSQTGLWSGVPGSLWIRNYRPSGDPSPFGIPHFSRRELAGASGSAVTYDFELHTLSSSGGIVVLDIALPDGIPTHTQTRQTGEVGPDVLVTSSGWSEMPVAFFDGEQFVQVGDTTLTPSQTGGGIFSGSDIEGFKTLQTSVQNVDNPGNGFPFAVSVMAEIHGRQALYSDNAVGGDSPLTRAAQYETFDHVVTASNIFPPFPSLASMLRGPSGRGGPVWGTYSFGPSSETLIESSFWVVNFENFESGGTGQVPIIADVQAPRGCYWYRTDGTMGVFIFGIFGVTFNADALKYRDIYFEVVGSRRLVTVNGVTTPEPHGFVRTLPEGASLTLEPHWEDPETILTRLWADVVVHVNNFGTPEMLPWMINSQDYVVLEG